jgi:hypothetical protein
LNVNGLNSPIKRHCLANRFKKEDPQTPCDDEGIPDEPPIVGNFS